MTGPYAFLNVNLMERTEQFTCTSGAAEGDAITIPTITVDGTAHRPVGYSIIGASADFNLKQGISGDLGDAIGLLSASLAANNQFTTDLDTDDIVVLSDGAGTATVNVRWFWYNNIPDGIAVGTHYDIILPIKTEALSAVTAEGTVTIPSGAQELVITGLDNDSLLYRVDNGTADGQQVQVDMAHVTYANPYSIFVHEDDRLRIQRSAGTDVAITGYWRIAR